jgi:iron complex transport system substrate-binding protein
MSHEELNNITGTVVDSAFQIHFRLGPGLLESVYDVLLAKDLTHRGLYVERQKAITFEFDGVIFEEGFIPDLLINRAVVIEVKAAEKNNLVFERQVNTYLKILDYRVGLVINFGMPLIKDGIRRVVNKI